MTSKLEIRLLGGFAVQLDGQSVQAFRTAKTRALLAYLAVEADREHSRTTLATLFWGELPDSAAKTNLRIELSNLKSVLGGHPALDVARTTLCFRSGLATTDVHTFRQAIGTFNTLPTEAHRAELAKIAAAIDLYQGEFLAGLHLNDAAEYEDWQLLTREQLHEQLMLALKTLQAGYAAQGRWVELAEAARRQLAIVPWTEDAYRYLMQALAAQGQLQAALAQFEKCRAVLQAELGVEPSLATLELAARLRGGEAARPAVQHNLAQQVKALVGRKEESTELQTLVKVARLTTVLGIGGVGKSHLAQSVAQSVLHDFTDGVWFVPLANIAAGEAAAERVALAIAATIGFQVVDLQTPLAELAVYLSHKQMLLVLDNWEHLIDAASTVLEALLNAPRLHILATSRVRLLVEGERIFQLEGLPRHEAYTLFVERARRVVPTFAANSAGVAQGEIFALCEQVAGLPLGIELAASWVEHYSVAEIGQAIGAIAIQPQQAGVLLARHHRLSNVFEFSWQLLSLRQQQILARLSVFRGGFDRVAATTVADSALHDLSALIAHSLVQRVTAGRYDLHPLIQEFAAGKLENGQAIILYPQYAEHYLATLVATPSSAWRTQLTHDFANIRHAWQRAIQARAAAMIQRAARTFAEYMHQFGLMSDGKQLLAAAVAQFEQEETQRELVAHLLDQQAIFVRGLEGLAGVAALQRRVLTLATDPKTRFFSHFDLANYHAEIGEWEEADLHFDRADAMAEESGDLAHYIQSIEGRIEINAIHFRGDFAQSIARLQELLDLLDTTPVVLENSLKLRLQVMQSLTLVAMRYGDYALAIRISQMGIQLNEEAGLRQRRGHILLNLALAEQFAGLYTAAIAHILDALAYAEEAGDVDEMALLKANLCLTLRQSGAWQEAVSYGVAAIEMSVRLGNRRIEGQARNRVGHALAMLEQWPDAYRTYGEALGIWAQMNHPNRYEAVAGRAVAALRLGKHAEALALVAEALAFVQDKGLMGIVEPVRLLLNCATVLAEIGQNERAHQTLTHAQSWVETIAGRISDVQVRTAFLDARPDNQLLKTRLAAFV